MEHRRALYTAIRYTFMLLVILSATTGCAESKPAEETDTDYAYSKYDTSKYDTLPTSPPPLDPAQVVIPPGTPTTTKEVPPSLNKVDIVENTYAVTDARKLTGLHSVQYDMYFRTAMSWHMPQVHWGWLKAQCWQESRFKPDAVSPVGAGGVCQFMPGTWESVPEHIREGREVWDARTNIEAGAWYMNSRYNFWTSPRPQLDRVRLAQACYNAGCGHVLNAQKACNMAITYDDIIACLPSITGHHSKETIGYVRLIDGFRRELGVPDPVSY